MTLPSNLPPLTAENEALYHYINYLRMMLRLTLSGILAGDFDGDKRQDCVDALRNELE